MTEPTAVSGPLARSAAAQASRESMAEAARSGSLAGVCCLLGLVVLTALPGLAEPSQQHVANMQESHFQYCKRVFRDIRRSKCEGYGSDEPGAAAASPFIRGRRSASALERVASGWPKKNAAPVGRRRRSSPTADDARTEAAPPVVPALLWSEYETRAKSLPQVHPSDPGHMLLLTFEEMVEIIEDELGREVREQDSSYVISDCCLSKNPSVCDKVIFC